MLRNTAKVFLLLSTFVAGNTAARVDVNKINASDVINYMDTATGAKYLLRIGTYKNKWHFQNNNKYDIEFVVGRSKPMGIPGGMMVHHALKGDTDCSGLVTHALRINGFFKPLESKSIPGVRATLSTTDFIDSRSKYGLQLISSNPNIKTPIRHGDIVNRKSPARGHFGHVFVFGGYIDKNSGYFVAHEAKPAGLGRFLRSWNHVRLEGTRDRSPYKVLRSSKVFDDINNRFFIVDPWSVKAVSTTFEEGRAAAPTVSVQKRFHSIQSGQTASSVARQFRITLSRLMQLNPQIKNFNNIKAGTRLRVR